MFPLDILYIDQLSTIHIIMLQGQSRNNYIKSEYILINPARIHLNEVYCYRINYVHTLFAL